MHAGVVAAAEAEGVSVSAWMTAAAEERAQAEGRLERGCEWEAEQGELTAAELAAARARVGRQVPAGQPKPVIYDAGALIAADRNDRLLWATIEYGSRPELSPSSPPR